MFTNGRVALITVNCIAVEDYIQFHAFRGQFIELRSGLINVCPMGRNCTNDEREIFINYDKVPFDLTHESCSTVT